MEIFQLQLFGRVQFITTDNKVKTIGGMKKRALIAILALSKNRTISREKAVGLLWGDRSQEQAQASLRQALSQLRKELSIFETPVVVTDRQTITLELNASHIDVNVFTELCERQDIASLEDAVNFYTGLALGNLLIEEEGFSDWQRMIQQNLEEQYRQILGKLISHNLANKNIEKSIDYSRDLLALDPADEKAHRAIMQIHALNGNLALAHKQFQNCVRNLETVYQATPSPETIKLMDIIKSGDVEQCWEKQSPKTKNNKTRSSNRWGTEVCVLPFQCAVTDVEAERLNARLSEDLLIAVSRFRWISTKSSGSSLVSRKEGVTAIEIARDLETDFVIDGYLRLSLKTISVFVEIVEVSSNTVVWSERYLIELNIAEDHFALLVSKITSKLEISLRGYLANQAIFLPDDEKTAFQHALLGLHCMYEMEESSYRTAKNMFGKAAEMDPNLSITHSWHALWAIFCHGQNWPAMRVSKHDPPSKMAKQAIQLDPEDAIALAILGHYEAFVAHQLDYAVELFERALRFNPHSSFVWMLSSATQSYIGNPKGALKRLKIAHKICPVEPQFNFMFNSAYCIAHLVDRNYEQAAVWGRKTVRENPSFSNGIKQLLVSLGHLNQVKEAKTYIKALEKLEPGFNLTQFVKNYPLKKPADRKRFEQGLILSGLN